LRGQAARACLESGTPLRSTQPLPTPAHLSDHGAKLTCTTPIPPVCSCSWAIHSSTNRCGSGGPVRPGRVRDFREIVPFSSNLQNTQTSITTTILPPVAFDFPPSTELCSQYLSILTVCFPLLLLQDKEHLLCMTNDVYSHIFTYIRSLRNASGTPNHRMTYQYTNTHTHYARNTADEGHPGGKQRTGEDSSSV